MKRKWVWCWVLLWAALWASSIMAQGENSLRLSLTRNFGVGLGTRIQGTFTMHVNGPEDLARVVFTLDNQIIGEDSSPPFRWQFRTDSFPPGFHSLGAVGYTAGGRQLQASPLTRDFLSKNESSQLTTALVVTLLILIVGGRMVTTWIVNRGQKASSGGDGPAATGMLGGTICPNCGRPYALHFWSINLMATRLDRCPYCRKWRLVRRVSSQALQDAAERFAQDTPDSSNSSLSSNQDDRWRQQLDDSRFDDSP